MEAPKSAPRHCVHTYAPLWQPPCATGAFPHLMAPTMGCHPFPVARQGPSMGTAHRRINPTLPPSPKDRAQSGTPLTIPRTTAHSDIDITT